jgi:transcriptional regulator with XRE-family HTH domain
MDIITSVMGRKSKLKLLSLPVEETFGQRLVKLRKKVGFTQVELAKKIGLTQGLVSDYELDKLRPYHEMVIRFAVALGVTTDDLLGLKTIKHQEDIPSKKILRRVKKIETLPPSQQKALLKTIDYFIKANEK